MQTNTTLFNKALLLLKNGKYREAIELFQKYLEEYPNDPTTYNNIGLAQLHLGIRHKDRSLIESANQHFKKAIAFIRLYSFVEFKTAKENLIWAIEELSKLN